MREKIYNIIEANTDTKGSKAYDTIMIVVIGVSIILCLRSRICFLMSSIK